MVERTAGVQSQRLSPPQLGPAADRSHGALLAAASANMSSCFGTFQ